MYSVHHALYFLSKCYQFSRQGPKCTAKTKLSMQQILHKINTKYLYMQCVHERKTEREVKLNCHAEIAKGGFIFQFKSKSLSPLQ